MSRARAYLLGVLTGVMLTAAVVLAVNTYDNFNRRLQYVEGYIYAQQMMLQRMR